MRCTVAAWSKPPSFGASTSFQISSSRLPCGCVMYSYARIIVRRSARAAGAIVMARSALKEIMILILIRGPRSIRFSFGWRGGLSLPVGVGLPLLARRAEPVQLELVVRDGEAVLLGHPVLKLLDSLVLELGDVAAGGADQVIVVVPIQGRLVAGLTALEVPRRRQPGVGEDLHRPVDGGGTDARIALLGLLHQLVDGEVAGLREERVDDQVALPRRLQPPRRDPAGEALVGGSGDLLWRGPLHFEIDSHSRKLYRAARGPSRACRLSATSRAAGPAPARPRAPARRRARRDAPD